MSVTPHPSFPAGHGKPVCVFCASSPGNDEMYTTAAESLGQALAGANVPVVYGGGRRGIMGVISQSTLQAGGYVHGVLPKALVTRASEFTERPHSSAAPTPPPVASAEGKGADLLADDFGGRLSMEVVGSMHERKAKMAKLSTGGFVVLPGGFGTYEELMEMITWNQIGMHALPVIVLNIGNYYTPMKAMIDNGVRAGFISANNAKLVEVIDLGDETANNDPARAAEWGPLALKTLQEWKFPNGAGYGFNWEDEKKNETASASTASASGSPAAVPYLFTTGRYTSSSAPLTPDAVPLWKYHVARLRTAHAHFAALDAGWGKWVGDDAVWAAVKRAIEAEEAKREATDWRLRIVLDPQLQVQLIPLPRNFAPINLSIPAQRTPTRKLYLDSSESPADALAYRQHKTSRREVYEAAAARALAAGAEGPLPEVVLHAAGAVLEGTTSNVAILRNGAWVTPRIGAQSPILAGTMRRYLLDTGAIVEGEVRVDEWEGVRAGTTRVVAFNGLRGVFEGEA